MKDSRGDKARLLFFRRGEVLAGDTRKSDTNDSERVEWRELSGWDLSYQCLSRRRGQMQDPDVLP